MNTHTAFRVKAKAEKKMNTANTHPSSLQNNNRGETEQICSKPAISAIPPSTYTISNHWQRRAFFCLLQLSITASLVYWAQRMPNRIQVEVFTILSPRSGGRIQPQLWVNKLKLRFWHQWVLFLVWNLWCYKSNVLTDSYVCRSLAPCRTKQHLVCRIHTMCFNQCLFWHEWCQRGDVCVSLQLMEWEFVAFRSCSLSFSATGCHVTSVLCTLTCDSPEQHNRTTDGAKQQLNKVSVPAGWHLGGTEVIHHITFRACQLRYCWTCNTQIETKGVRVAELHFKL